MGDRTRVAVIITFASLLAAPQAAVAATASVQQIDIGGKYQESVSAAVLTAAPGEANRIVAARRDAGAPIVLQDAGAALQPGAGCAAIDANTVSCAATSVAIDAGDGDDVVVLSGAVGLAPGATRAYVSGGDGADALSGSGVLSGGAGNDVLSCTGACAGAVLGGGGGDDVLLGGSGDDVLSGDGDGQSRPGREILDPAERGPAGSDRIDGGGGRDRLTYVGRRTGAFVDLAERRAGRGGEHDRLSGIEDVVGGSGDDALLGDERSNRLEGRSGSDQLGGRAGDDELYGDRAFYDDPDVYGPAEPDLGPDVLVGGSGDDLLDGGGLSGDALSGGPGADVLRDGNTGRAGTARAVDCGLGADKVTFDPRGRIVIGCERLTIGGVAGATIGMRPQRGADGRLRLRSSCAQLRGCVLTVGIRFGGSVQGRRVVKLRRGAARDFSVPLRRRARRGQAVDVRVAVGEPGGQPVSAHWRVGL